MHLRHGKTPSDLSNKLLVDKAFTDDNIKRLTNDINQAFPRPQQAFLPIPYDYHVSTSGYMRLQLYHLNRVLNGSAQLSPLKAGSPDDIPNWVLREFALELAQPVCSVLNASLLLALCLKLGNALASLLLLKYKT